LSLVFVLPLDPFVRDFSAAQKVESEPQNIECRMPIVEVKTCGNRLRDSIFIIRMAIWLQP
jgi:hypothetical protein